MIQCGQIYLGITIFELFKTTSIDDDEFIKYIDNNSIGKVAFNEWIQYKQYVNMEIIRSYTEKLNEPNGYFIKYFVQIIYENARNVYCTGIKILYDDQVKLHFLCIYKYSPETHEGVIYPEGTPLKGCDIGRNPNYKGLCCVNDKEIVRTFY